MKLLPVKLLMFTVVLCTLSCRTIDYTKRYPNMVANADPVSAGKIEVQLNKLFFSPKLTKMEVEVIFYPRSNSVALVFRYELIRHRQFWDLEGRKQFAEALEQYKADYEAHNLIDRYRKTRSVYGKVQGKLEWETFKYTRTRLAYPIIDLGYRFRDGMPFFTTFMRSAKEELESGDNSERIDSSQINMFFTRAQAEELVKRFDQDYLMGLLGVIPGPQSGEQQGEQGEEETEIIVPYREYGG